MGKHILLAITGEETKESVFDEDATVEDILDFFEENTEKGDEIAINGNTVTMNTVPVAGQLLYISKGTSGSK